MHFFDELKTISVEVHESQWWDITMIKNVHFNTKVLKF